MKASAFLTLGPAISSIETGTFTYEIASSSSEGCFAACYGDVCDI